VNQILAQSRILKLVSEYEEYRSLTLNLIPSENVLSRDVLRVLATSMAGRYAGRPESYGGTKIFQKIWDQVEELSMQIFDCDFATVLPVSGHIAGMMVLDSLCEYGKNLATLSMDHGGYTGYNAGRIPELLGMEVGYLPFDIESWNIDLDKALDYIEDHKPSIVILGATVFLFPHPVSKIAKAVHSYGGRLIYDASHVIGLIAGGQFQEPLNEGADLVLGSTHKTLFGPQGGLILSNDSEIARKIRDRALYRFVDNFHLNRVAALGVALEEAKIHGRAYANEVIRNSKALAAALSGEVIPVVGKGKGFTESHQVFLNYGRRGTEIRDALEKNGIISDSRVRLGTNEVTRRGMKVDEMKEVSGLIASTLRTKRGSTKIKKRVRNLVARYKDRILFTLRT
jgi:glycine hydroxymethyltransferase